MKIILFQWYKNDIAIEDANELAYTIDDFNANDAGIYYSEIKNSDLPNLTLRRAPIKVLYSTIFITLSNDSINENLDENTLIGTFQSTDTNTTLLENIIYEISQGSEFFKIEDDELLSKIQFDFELRKSYEIKVIATNQDDDITGEETFTIHIRDIEEALSLPHEDAIGITIYPNPTKEKFNLTIDNSYIGMALLKIYSSKGSLVKEYSYNKSLERDQHIVDVKNLSTGLYYISIELGMKKLTKKLVK